MDAEWLKRLCFRLELAESAYRGYLAHGKTFLFASLLRDHNLAIREIAVANGHQAPDELRADLQRLIEHLDIWIGKWSELQRRNDPSLDDEFVFENRFNFPSDSVQRLKASVRR